MEKQVIKIILIFFAIFFLGIFIATLHLNKLSLLRLLKLFIVCSIRTFGLYCMMQVTVLGATALTRVLVFRR